MDHDETMRRHHDAGWVEMPSRDQRPAASPPRVYHKGVDVYFTYDVPTLGSLVLHLRERLDSDGRLDLVGALLTAAPRPR